MLDHRALNRASLQRQMLLQRSDRSVSAALEHLVGIQAQLPLSPYVGLWSRLESFRPDDLAKLIERRKAVRIALMRSTIHLVTARDCLRLRPVIAPVLERMFAPNSPWRAAVDGLDIADVTEAARAILGQAPRGHKELGTALAERFGGRDALALAHLVRNHAGLAQIPPRGVWGKKGPLALQLAEVWLGKPFGTDASPGRTLLRYLAAFGPASLADFRRWSGLTGISDTVERLRPKLRAMRAADGRELLDLLDAPLPERDTPVPPRFTPEFDNILIGYAERSRFIPPEHFERVTKSLGKPVLLVDGTAAAFWRIDRKRDAATLTIDPFVKIPRSEKVAIEQEGHALLAFVTPGASTHDVRLS